MDNTGKWKKVFVSTKTKRGVKNKLEVIVMKKEFYPTHAEASANMAILIAKGCFKPEEIQVLSMFMAHKGLRPEQLN